jgi:putative hydrolase of the HAD superfamily
MASSGKIRAVTFDVGGTLIECWPSVGHIYAEVAARNGHPNLTPAVLNKNFKTTWRAFKSFSHTPADWSALVDATFRGLVEPPPSQTFFPQLFERFSEPDAWHIFDDVLPTLTQLKSRSLKLGIVSNWDDRLKPLLGKLQLDSYFETIVVSYEVGVHKPSRKLFERVCAALNSDPAQTLHVGDSFEMDVQGAKAAGLQALWLCRGGREPRPKVIRSLRQLDKI